MSFSALFLQESQKILQLLEVQKIEAMALALTDLRQKGGRLFS